MYSIVGSSLLQLKDNILGKKYRMKKGMPYMMRRELAIFKALLTQFQPQRVLEWGSGYSTVWFPQYLTSLENWISIENNAAWANQIKKINTFKQVEVHYVKEDNFPWTDEQKDGSYEDLKTYIEYPEQFAKFDLIIIDGRSRRECLKRAKSLLNESGVILLHDANRGHYYEGLLDRFENHYLLTDYRRTAGGILILCKNVNLDEYINIDKHKSHWKYFNNKFCKILAI